MTCNRYQHLNPYWIPWIPELVRQFNFSTAVVFGLLRAVMKSHGCGKAQIIIENICELTGIPLTTIKCSIKALIDAGLIIRTYNGHQHRPSFEIMDYDELPSGEWFKVYLSDMREYGVNSAVQMGYMRFKMNGNGCDYASMATRARETGMSKYTVKNVVHDLVTAGLVAVDADRPYSLSGTARYVYVQEPTIQEPAVVLNDAGFSYEQSVEEMESTDERERIGSIPVLWNGGQADTPLDSAFKSNIIEVGDYAQSDT